MVPGCPVLVSIVEARLMMSEPLDRMPMLPLVKDDRPLAHDPAEDYGLWVDWGWGFGRIPFPEA